MRNTFKFTIGPYDVGSFHNMEIIAVDQLGFESNNYSFGFIIVANRTPELQADNISYVQFYTNTMRISGSVRDMDSASTVSLYTSIDDKNLTKHKEIEIKSDSWMPFIFERQLISLSLGIHDLMVYSVDDKEAVSNKIMFPFAVIDPKKYYVGTCFYYCTHFTQYEFLFTCLIIQS